MSIDHHLNDMVEAIGAKATGPGTELARIYVKGFMDRNHPEHVTALADRLRTKGMFEIAEAISHVLTQPANT